MKLIYCEKCYDIYNVTREIKRCSCGATIGLHIDRETLIYGGNSAVCLGIDNYAFHIAEGRQKIDGYAIRFDSWVCSLYTNSTVKVSGLEYMDEKEIYQLLAKYNLRKRWDQKVEKRRSGISRLLYLFGKSLMRLEIKRTEKSYLTPELDTWYSNFTERVLKIAERLTTVQYYYGKTELFQYLLSVLFRNPEFILKLEKIDNNEDLYDEFENYIAELKEKQLTESANDV